MILRTLEPIGGRQALGTFLWRHIPSIRASCIGQCCSIFIAWTHLVRFDFTSLQFSSFLALRHSEHGKPLIQPSHLTRRLLHLSHAVPRFGLSGLIVAVAEALPLDPSVPGDGSIEAIKVNVSPSTGHPVGNL
jgi:hypothetical protein